MSHMQDVILESIITFNSFSSESLILASLSIISMSHMQDNNIVEIDNNIGHCASFLKWRLAYDS